MAHVREEFTFCAGCRFCRFLGLFQFLLALLACRDVADEGSEEVPLVRPNGVGNRDFDRKLTGVPVQRGEFESLVDDGSFAGFEKAAKPPAMPFPKGMRNND